MDADVAHVLRGTPVLPSRSVALTFDDGPGPQSAELARLLQAERIPATFFVLGESIERYGDVLAVHRECGHAIGLHGDRHHAFRSAEHAADQVYRCADSVREALGDAPGPAWFRPPYGRGDWAVPGLAGPVGWQAHGRDWEITYGRGPTVPDCVESIAEGIVRSDGGIVLLHDFVAATEFRLAGRTEADLNLRIIEITELLIQRLRKEGFSFVALPEPDRAAEPAPPALAATSPAAGARPARTRPSEGLLAAEELATLRLYRAAAAAAGGILDPVVPMRTGEDPPLFCVHPLMGLSWCYMALLPHVDPQFPLYGLQARGLRRPEPLPSSIQEMARDYIAQMRTVQPSGPYHLLGWSLGGNIAFAVAEELERVGEELGLLVILDSTLEDQEGFAYEEPWMIYNLILAQFGYVPAMTPADADPGARMLELIRRRPGLGLDEWPDQRIRALQRILNNNVAIASRYRPGRVRSPLLFISATRNPPTLEEKLASWATFVDGPTEYIEVDSGHRHMLLPDPVAKIGPALSERLARAAAAYREKR